MRYVIFVLVLLAGNLQASAQEHDSMKEATFRSFLAGNWVDTATIIDNPVTDIELSYMTEKCAITVLKANEDHPRTLLFTGSGMNRVAIFERNGETVYQDVSLGKFAEDLKRLRADDENFAECADQVRYREGFPESIRPLFRGFRGLR